MALFFDADWFDAKLASLSLTRSDAARVLGLDDAAIVLLWKDQRELSARDVAVLAALLGVAAEEVADRAGTSTPVPRTVSDNPAALAAQPGDITERLARLERTLAEIKALLLEMRARP
jgi:transcriptional regulator with XRE-family HTH domain